MPPTYANNAELVFFDMSFNEKALCVLPQVIFSYPAQIVANQRI